MSLLIKTIMNFIATVKPALGNQLRGLLFAELKCIEIKLTLAFWWCNFVNNLLFNGYSFVI